MKTLFVFWLGVIALMLGGILVVTIPEGASALRMVEGWVCLLAGAFAVIDALES